MTTRFKTTLFLLLMALSLAIGFIALLVAPTQVFPGFRNVGYGTFLLIPVCLGIAAMFWYPTMRPHGRRRAVYFVWVVCGNLLAFGALSAALILKLLGQ